MPLPALLLSALPYLGTAAAGFAGSKLAGLGGGGNTGSLGGSPARTQQTPLYTPQQSQALDQLLSMGLGGLQKNQFDFAPIEQQARTQFQTQTIPSLAERFSSLGSEGAQRGSAFQGALGQAGAGLEQSLAALKANYGLQQQGQLQNLLNLGLRPRFESTMFEREPGFLESFASQTPQLLPLLLKLYLSSQGAQ